MNPFKLKALVKKTYIKTNKLPIKIGISLIIMALVIGGLTEIRIIGHSFGNSAAPLIGLLGLGALVIYILVYLWSFWEEWHLATHGDKEA